MAFQIANQTFYFVIVGSEHNTNKQTNKKGKYSEHKI